MTMIKGTNIRCIGNVEGNFEQLPHAILEYMKLGLISGNDLAVYFMLLKNDNDKKGGYAFPTTKQIALETGIGEKTVKKATKKLVDVGLIKKEKAPNYPNKNIYFVLLPLEKEELFGQVPELVKKFEQKKLKMENEAIQEKLRLDTYYDLYQNEMYRNEYS